jgi:hypothetical protein
MYIVHYTRKKELILYIMWKIRLAQLVHDVRLKLTEKKQYEMEKKWRKKIMNSILAILCLSLPGTTSTDF